MKKRNEKNFAAAAAALALCLLAGCSAPSTVLSQPENKAAGALLLSVNPEIELEYDHAGQVLEAKGLNEDGKAVLEGLGELQGQNCGAALNQLVCEIYESGYFEKTVDGHPKNIVLKLKEGSVYPDDDFLEDIASQTVTVGKTELNKSDCIGQEKAKEIVLAQLGLKNAEFHEQKYDPKDGEYEFEFIANGMEYEFDVDARTGKVTKADAEPDDDGKWDALDDDRDDPDDHEPDDANEQEHDFD